MAKSQEEVAIEAINHALKSLRKRHLLEEAAHAPALLALSRPIVSQVSSLVTIFMLFRDYYYLI